MVRRKIPIFKIIRKSKDKKPKYRKIKSIKDLIKNKRRRSLFCRENTQKEPREIQKNIQLTRKIQNQRNFEIHPLKNGLIILLKQNSWISLSGLFKATIIYGSVKTHGSNIKAPSSMNFFATDMEIVTFVTDSATDGGGDVLNIINKNHIETKLKHKYIRSIIKIQKHFTKFEDFISSFRIFHKSNFEPQILDQFFDINEYSIWEKACQKILVDHTKIFVCGKKRIGKSSFIRFLANYLIPRGKDVYIIDCDTDQSMLNPPTQISLHKIDYYCHTSPYFQNKAPLTSIYIGDADPSFQSLRYVHGVRFLFKEFEKIVQQNKNIFLLINTFSWIRDYGMGYLTDIIQICAPDLCLQIVDTKENPEFFINSNNELDGFLSCTTAFNDYVSRGRAFSEYTGINYNPSSELNNDDSTSNFEEHKYAQDFYMPQNIIDSVVNSNPDVIIQNKNKHNSFKPNKLNFIKSTQTCKFSTITIRPYFLIKPERQKEEKEEKIHDILWFLTYFGTCHSIFEPNLSKNNFFPTLIPYKFQIHKIHFSFFDRQVYEDTIQYAFRLNIVGLLNDPHLGINGCQILVKNKYNFNIVSHSTDTICIGLGFVRNVDTEEGNIYIVTPIDEEKIKNINVIAVGKMVLPQQLLSQTHDTNIAKDFEGKNWEKCLIHKNC